jgi:hypothetical protein
VDSTKPSQGDLGSGLTRDDTDTVVHHSSPESPVISKQNETKMVPKLGETMIYERLLFTTGPYSLLRKNLTKRVGTAPLPATDLENNGIG